MGKSHIEWTEQTWNPTTGCSKVSAGCKNCYAETMSFRLQRMGTKGYEQGFQVALHRDRIKQPLNRKKPTTYFVNSMSDLFHEKIPFAFLDEVFTTIIQTPHHRYQILTKRPAQMQDYFEKRTVPNNVWLGVSVENKRNGLPRIDVLRKINCKVRFLSCEPLLEDLESINLQNIHWVIVGGESGTKARPMSKEWVLNIKKQCNEQKTQFFFKQWGTWGVDGIKRSKHHNGRILQGKEWNSMPQE